jgi:CheY-like chemotaxis protein
MVFSRKMESEFVSIDLNDVVDQMSIILKRTIPKMINIRLDLDENPCSIKADAVQLEQIMMNVAINARDAMPEGGCLTYKTRNIEINKDSGDIIPGLAPGEYALLSISDTGHGIEKVTINRIFEPFFTTKKKGEGTGLGLAMVYGIVKNHGGYINCSSEISKGTTFDIYFPLVRGYSMSKELDIRKDHLKGGNETILFVDDEKSNREIGKEILSGFGYNVIPAANGEEALECYRKNRNTIGLVILDLIMPGIGGRKCLEKLIEENPDINVIISSGYSASKAVEDALEAGAKGFIGKPYNLKKMLEVIRSVFD